MKQGSTGIVLFTILVVVSAISGCSYPAPVDPLLYPPVREEPAGRGASPGEEGRAGGNPAAQAPAPPAGPLTLQACIDRALAANPVLAAARSEVEAAGARVDTAAGARWPSLDVRGGYTHTLNDQALIPFKRPGDFPAFTDDVGAADLVVDLPLFTGGRLTSGIRAAELLHDAAEHRLARTRRELVFNVSSVFFGMLAQEKVIEALRFSRKTLEEHLKRVEHMLEVQKAARIDRLRTQVRLADIERRIVEARNTLAVQRRLLANLLGVEKGGPPLEIQGELAETPVEVDLAGSLARAFRSRGDYLAARSAVDARAQALEEAKAARWPTLLLRGSYGGRWALGSTLTPGGADTFEDVGQIGVSVDLPLFRGGAISARIREEESRLLSARAELREAALRVRLDVESAVLAVDSARAQIRATRSAVDQGREALRIEREKYALGKGSMTDLLDAQDALLEVETGYDRALSRYNIALAQLRLAMGEE